MMKTPVIYVDGMPREIGEGLYFGMPDSQYFDIPALSSTGFKNILVSPPDFFFNSWLNPLKDEDAEDEDSQEWKKFGHATHTRILEGKQVFESQYVVEFIPPEGFLKTVDDMKKALTDAGVPFKSAWKKPDYIAAIHQYLPSALLYDDAEQKYFRETNGRIQLSQRDIRRIEIAAAMIENHPDLRYYFNGGCPEVTVVWKEQFQHPITKQIITLWFKARLDYLKPAAIVDLKSFTNMQNKPIDKAIHEAMAARKYHIQVAHYTVAARKAVDFAIKGLVTTNNPARYQPTPQFMELLMRSTSHEFFLCFQKKGGAPLARGKKFGSGLSMFACGQASIAQAIDLFIKYYGMFGEGVWVDDTPTTDFEDAMFPAYAVEI